MTIRISSAEVVVNGLALAPDAVADVIAAHLGENWASQPGMWLAGDLYSTDQATVERTAPLFYVAPESPPEEALDAAGHSALRLALMTSAAYGAAHAARLARQAPGATVWAVRAEASRRMQALVGARDADHLAVIVSNASREAIRLLRKGANTWTEQEAQRAAELEAVDVAIEAIRAKSNALEAMQPIPSDYRNDSYWSAS